MLKTHVPPYGYIPAGTQPQPADAPLPHGGSVTPPAPFWTPEQVVTMDEYQRGEGQWSGFGKRMHPFTCPNRGDGQHRRNSVDLGALVPTVRGWICPYCDYAQSWSHGFMTGEE